MKVWCFWMAVTMCCLTLMPIFFARSLLVRAATPTTARHPTGH